jgi:predicted O-linked N-acetylglucosamine transferase (SPINDLY family)
MTQGGPQGLYPSQRRAPGPKEAGLIQKLRQAWTLHQQGRLDEAEPLYREVLAQAPGNPDALHFLGVLEFQRGNKEAALALLERAIQAAPENAAAIYNRGNFLRESGRLDEALASYDRVVALRPDHAGAANNRGVVLFKLGRHDEAIASYDRALAIKPDHADALFNRGNALGSIGHNEEALSSYARALAIAPIHAGALYGRGNVLGSLKRFEEAIASYDRALAAEPDNADILNSRGNALGQVNRLDEALANFARAIAVKPEYAEAFNNRGNVFISLKQHDEAANSFERALAIRPDYADALYGRAYALTELRRLDEAIEAFERLLAIRPDYPYAMGMLLHAKNTACDWQDRVALASAVIDGVQTGQRVATPLAFFAVSDSTEDNTLCSRIVMDDKHPTSPHPLWRGDVYRHDRIRVAYLSADFNVHPVSLLMAGVIEHHDKARFETVAISYGREDESAMRARLRQAFERFLEVRGQSDFKVASLLREIETDIVVDLTGLTGAGRPGILIHRPAAIQVQHLGFPGSMGADHIDYILADRVVIPEADRAQYREHVVYLPDSFLPNDDKRATFTKRPSRAEVGLPDSGFVFASFNNSYKFTPEMFDVWMRLLHEVEGSVLWLPEGNEAARRNLAREATARNVDARRLIFAAYAPAEEDHLARLSLADLFLDTLPYNAHATAADALWAGLPLLTTPGNSFPGRVAASLLHAAHLPELVAPSIAQYEAAALGFARNREGLTAIREKLAQARQTSPLFDTARFTANLEAAYTAMWERLRRGLPPESFAVAGGPALS